jgi:DNA mismatch repair protein MSH6
MFAIAFVLCQFSDDSARSRLCSLLSEIRPVELIKPSGILSNETEKVLRNETRKPLVNNLIPGREFWDAETSLIEIKKLYALFSERSKSRNEATDKAECVYSDTTAEDNKIESLPDVICQVVSAGENGQLALSAFGGCLSYLRQVLLDKSLLSFGKLEILPCSDFVTMQSASDKSNRVFSSQDAHLVEPYMVLDAAALENLEILENNQDGSSLG